MNMKKKTARKSCWDPNNWSDDESFEAICESHYRREERLKKKRCIWSWDPNQWSNDELFETFCESHRREERLKREDYASSAKINSSNSASTQSETSSQNISKDSNSENSKNSSPIITSSIHTKSPYSQIKVSTRLAIYWPLDEAYYNATVIACKKSKNDNEQSFFVTLIYDDDEVETIDLVKEKFNILDTTTKSNTANEDYNDTKKRAKKGLAKDISPPLPLKKRRVIEEFEDEGEEMFQDDDKENSEGSKFLAHSSEDESMNDAQSDSAITDDDNEAVSMTKRIKTVRVSSGEGGKNHLHLTSYENKIINSSTSLSPVAQDSKPRTQSTKFSSLTPPPKSDTSSTTSSSFSEFSRESTSQDGNAGKSIVTDSMYS